MIQETINPFDVNLDPDKLYNIGTELAAMDSTQIFYWMYLKMGKMNEKLVSKNAHNGLKNHLKAKKLFHLLQKLGNRK